MQRMNIIGWQIDAYDYDGRTALGVAASEGHLDAVKYLITHGANPLHRDFRNNTALDDARRENRETVIDYLEGLRVSTPIGKGGSTFSLL